jgi:hypothetical protein
MKSLIAVSSCVPSTARTSEYPHQMAFLLAIALAFSFGAADQYLGSVLAHPWAADVSLLSAPWLVLPFLAGWTQRDPKRAAVLGLACTMSALLGYGLMTLSPMEGAELTVQTARGFVVSSSPVILGGLLTGLLFGWLGNRWRNDRAWLGALALALAVCLEPLARIAYGQAIRFRTVSLAEVVVGLAMVVYVAAAALTAQGRSRRIV